MQDLQGQYIKGRPIRINLKTEKASSASRHRQPTKVWDQNWERWEIPSRAVKESAHVFDRWNRDDAQAHWSTPEKEKRRLHVGGLPRIPNQDSLNAEMRDLFQGCDVQAVSKLISPHRSQRATPGSHYYCFVDLSTAQEAKNAARALNGKETPYGDKYVVSVLHRKGNNTTIVEREQLGATSRILVGHLPNYPDQAALDNDIRQLLCIFEIVSISKLHPPSAGKLAQGGNHHFCFVEMKSPQDAEVAIYRFNELPTPWGGTYKLRMARGPEHDVRPNERTGQAGSQTEQRGPQGPPSRNLDGNWRQSSKVLADNY